MQETPIFRICRLGLAAAAITAATVAQSQPSTPASEYRVTCDKTCLLQFADERLVRRELADGKGGNGEECEWRIPDARVRFDRWTRSGRAHAVAVHTGVEMIVSGEPVQKLAKVRVFFLDSVPGRLVREPAKGKEEQP